jgi:hypothetical protein
MSGINPPERKLSNPTSVHCTNMGANMSAQNTANAPRVYLSKPKTFGHEKRLDSAFVVMIRIQLTIY